MRPSWLALLLLVPLGAGQPMPPVPDSYGVTVTGEPTQLYFHLINIQDFPINTQEPDDAWVEESSYGTGTSTMTCVSPVVGNTLGAQNEFHTFRGYDSPALVGYDEIENGVPRLHPERGISYDILLDGAPTTLYWYAKTEPNAPALGGEDALAPTPVSNVVVRATVRTGDVASTPTQAYDSGELIAQGETMPATLAGDATIGSGGVHPQVRRVRPTGVEGYVYEFAVPLQFAQSVIPRAVGYNVRIDMYADNPWCADPGGAGYVMPNLVSMVTAPGARPRMAVQPMEPLRLEYLHPQFVGDELVFHTSLNSPWGEYDVDQANATAAIYGPSNATSLFPAVFVQRANEHYSGPEALDLAYVWSYQDDKAKPGIYTFVLRVPNLQGTAYVEATSRFEIGGDAQQELPGPALPLLVLCMLAALAVYRRR